MGDEAVISYFFSFIPTHPFVRGDKNSFTHEFVLKKGVWQKKKLTTAHEVAVSYAKHDLYLSISFIKLILTTSCISTCKLSISFPN